MRDDDLAPLPLDADDATLDHPDYRAFYERVMLMLGVQSRLQQQGRRKRDWHKKWRPEEPQCDGHQWRQRDRYAVIDISAMGDNHLKHALRFAATKKQHASRLSALLAEKNRRNDVQGR